MFFRSEKKNVRVYVECGREWEGRTCDFFPVIFNRTVNVCARIMWFTSSDHFRMSSFKTKLRRKKYAFKQQFFSSDSSGAAGQPPPTPTLDGGSSVAAGCESGAAGRNSGCSKSVEWEFVNFNPAMFGSRRNSIALSNPVSGLDGDLYAGGVGGCGTDDLDGSIGDLPTMVRDRCHSFGKEFFPLFEKPYFSPSDDTLPRTSTSSSTVTSTGSATSSNVDAVKRRSGRTNSKGSSSSSSRPSSRPSSWLSALPLYFFPEDEPDLGDKSSAFNNKNNRVEPVREAAEERLTAVTVPSDAQYNSENENHFVQDVTHNLKYNKSSGASINRSESYKERLHQKRQIREKRKTSDPNLPITNNDVENETPVHHPFSYSTANSGSSSNSNLSTRSLDSPSNSLEAVSNNSRNSCDNTSSSNTSTNATVLTNNISSINRTSAWDSDTEAEQDPPDWTKCVSEEVLRQLSTIEKKRQEVINELFHTERSHVRALKILDQLFYQPMKELQILPSDQINLLFPNLEEMLEIHSQFNNNMKQKKKENPIVQEIGDILLKMFDGAEGEQFQQAAATFCSRQQIALGALKERRKKDPKLNNFLSDAEGNPICRRLQLKDIIPTGMLRLTKYPLLFENLAKYSRFSAEEERSIQRALERSKDILNHVNAAVKEAEDQYRLAEIQKRLDKSLFDKLDHPVTNEFKNLDLTKHKLITEGSLNLRITNRQKLIELHVLLLEDVIILLQKQDEKYVLKFYNTNSSTGERTPILSPVIKVSTALVRPNATDKKALFLVNTSHNGAQIYDLVASTSAEKKTWFRHISEAAEAYKTKDGKHKARTADSSPVTGHELDSNAEPVQQHAKQKSEETKTEESGIQDDNHNVTSNSLNSSAIDTDSPVKKLAGLSGAGKSPGKPRKRVTEPPRLTTEENPLIEPSQVLISQRSVLTAEPVLTPLEKLRRKDELIRNALKEKQQLVADILHVPREEYETIVDLAGEPAFDKEASELVLAAVNQVDQLTAVINECLHVTDEEAIIATSEVHSATQQTQLSKVSRLPNVPVSKVQLIANSISSHLTQLLSLMTERDQERERLRQELQRSREQLHALHEIQQRIEQTNSDNADNNYADKKREELSTKEVSTSSESNNSTTNKES